MRRILASIALGAALTWSSLAPAAAHPPPETSCGLGVWGTRLETASDATPGATKIATFPPNECLDDDQSVRLSQPMRPIRPVGPIE